MAITLPGALLIYEAVFHPYLKNLWQRLGPILGLAAMAALCMSVKIFIPNAMSITAGYAPHLHLTFILSQYLHYYQLLFFDNRLSGIALTLILALALLAAAALRNRLMLFGLLFANLALFPLSVILPRAGFVWYMPLLGYALYGGALVSLAAEAFTRFIEAHIKHDRPRSQIASAVQAAFLGVLTIVSYAAYSRQAGGLGAPFLPEQQNLRSLLTAAQTAAPSLPRGSRILVERDTFPQVWWWPLFLIRLGYQDPTLWVQRVSHLGDAYHPDDVSLYALRIRWDGSRYQTIVQPQATNPLFAFQVTPAAVRRGQTAHVQLPAALSGCPIDVAYRMPDDELMRGGIWSAWTQTDSSGEGIARIDSDAERGRVVIDRIRACHREWLPARAAFEVTP